mgnify:CR=1 FL=1
MFTIVYVDQGNRRKETTQDIKNLYDIVIGITGDDMVAEYVQNWACNASFGDNRTNTKHGFTVKCHYDERNVYPPNKNTNSVDISNIRLLQKIADEITKQTGIENQFIGEDNDSLTWDFATGVSYMKNKGGKGLYFALNDDNGKEICDIQSNDVSEFIRKVVTIIKRREASKVKREITGSSKVIKSNLSIKQTGNVVYVTAIPNKEIIAAIKNAASAKIEWHGRIYDDGCWWINLERHPYGQVRFWVGYEDKRSGNGNGSIYSIYRYEGNIRTSCEFTVKKVVANKIESIFKALEKEGFV